MSVSCGQAVIDALEARGVDVVFGIPGTHTLPLYEALANSGICHVTPRQEQGGGYAADGYARGSGRPGVCIVTTGPGLTNVITAAATAHHDSVPLLILTPGMPSFAEGRDVGFLHQVKGQSAAMEHLVDASHRVASASEAVAAIDDAFRRFADERPRPIHIEIPIEVLEGDGTGAVSREVSRSKPVPAEGQLDSAVELLAGAREPWLLLGGGSKGAALETREIAELLGAVVVTTVNAKGVVPESHPLSIGASLRLAPARDALAGADVVLAIGTEIGESDLWTTEFGFDGAVVRVDIDVGQLRKNAIPEVALHGEAGAVTAALIERLRAAEASASDGAVRARALRSELDGLIAADGAEYVELHRGLRELLDDDAVVTGDSSMVSYYGTVHQFPVDHPRRFLYPVGYATLGYSLPAAIGAKLAAPEQDVVAIDGDGGFLFTATELVTASELGLPIPVIIVNNGGYGEIRAGMLARGAKPIGVDLQPVDFPGLSEALGGIGISLDDESRLPSTVREALTADRPTVIELTRPRPGAAS